MLTGTTFVLVGLSTEEEEEDDEDDEDEEEVEVISLTLVVSFLDSLSFV
jgi:hypothetical protein